MNNTSFNTKNTGSKMNTTTVLVLIVAALPILLFAMTKMFPPTVDAPSSETTAVSGTKANRVSAAERRAQRAEARKAKKAEKAATVTTMQTNSFPAPMEPMEFNGFGPGMGFDNGMAMGPGGFGGGFGPGGFGGGFGPGMF
jgi:hypothetical protein